MITMERKDTSIIRTESVELPAIVQYNDILNACKTEPDYDCNAPWEDDEGWSHECNPIEMEEVRSARGAFYGDREYQLVSIPDTTIEAWHGPKPKGMSKQVWREFIASRKRAAIDQLVSWRSNGWFAYGATCDFMGYHDSCWGFIDGDVDYQSSNRAEIASNIVSEMQADGFEIVGIPVVSQISSAFNRMEMMRHGMNMGNWSTA